MASNNNEIIIGQYQILKTLGVGSFGKVKLAVHAITKHKVALKIINRKKIAKMDMVGRVRREIQYLKLLRHPHVIKLYEVITTPTDIIMVIEYAEGELFNYIVERGRMQEDVARKFFQQIICAVEYCHRHKIVHRDLKPENLLLDQYNNVKIADFGLSNIMTDGDFLKTSCGSPNYAAPEVISGKLYAGPEVDVWSCGVILYVMLCGRLPFDDDYIPTLFKKINGGIYTLPSYLSPETKQLLQLMLVVDPLKRITIQEIRQNPWFNHGLPDYLKPLPEIYDDPFQVDETIVDELHNKMGFTRQAILKALHDPKDNQIKVAYQLVVDHKRMLNDAKKHPQKSIQSFFAASPPPWNYFMESSRASEGDQSLNEDELASSITVLSSSLPDRKSSREHRHRSHTLTSARPNIVLEQSPRRESLGGPPVTHPDHAPAHISTSTAQKPPSHHPSSSSSNAHGLNSSAATPTTSRRHKSRPRWHFGIRSRSPPLEVMLEIYRALKKVGFEWKPISTFHVRCRYIFQNDLILKMDLQLYKLETNHYLVDFKYVGSTLPTRILSNTSSSSKNNADTSIHSSKSAPTLSTVATPRMAIPTGRNDMDRGEGSSERGGGGDRIPIEDDEDEEDSNMRAITPSDGHDLEFSMEEGYLNLPLGVGVGTSGRIGAKEVTSVFPFFEVCSKLITELAIMS
ncbi:uncharacterized protein VTP21DRAFT_8063 [Calcarisporiella thermophila]|uniref:uncharacterized protein n=1 Tax=Calcarisporiella thermophila TaxID=911321 RepID=UPI0037449AFC